MLLFLPESKQIQAATDVTAPLQETEPAVDAPAQSPRLAWICPCAGLPGGAFFLGVGAFLNGIGFMAFDTIGVVYIQDTFFNGDPDKATLFWSQAFSVCGVVGLFTSLVIFRQLSAHLQKTREAAMVMRLLITLGGFCSVGGFFAIGFPVDKFWLAAWIQVIVMGETIINPSVRTTLTFIVDGGDYGKAFGMMASVSNIAKALGPLIFAPIYEFVGHTLPWFVNSVIKAAAILFILAAKKKKNNESTSSLGQSMQPTAEMDVEDVPTRPSTTEANPLSVQHTGEMDVEMPRCGTHD